MKEINLQDWEEKGYIIVRGLLPAVEIDELSTMINKVLDGELKPELAVNGVVPEEFGVGWEPGLVDRTDLPRRERVRLVSWLYHQHPYFKKLLAHPAIFDVASQLFNSGVQIFGDAVFIKPARHGIAAAPHQDTAFWNKLKPNAINFWMAVDPATIENGCLYVIPGSHKKDLPHHSDPVMSWYLDETQADFDRQIPIELAPGDAIFFDSALVHRSYPNKSDHSRRSMTASYVAENVVHEEEWTHRHHFSMLERGGG